MSDGGSNNLLATGYVTGVLHQSGRVRDIEVATDDKGNVTNVLFVRMEGFKSQYRITVEIVPGTEREWEW